MLEASQYPTAGSYDVVVAGGGTAGFAAAVAAAKAGSKVLIIEERAVLGGNSTGGMINMFLGFARGEYAVSTNEVFGEVLQRLIEAGASNGIVTIYINGLRDMDVGAAPYDSDTLKCIMDDMVTEAGAEVLFHTRVIGASMAGSQIESILIHNSQGIRRVKAKVFIDATFHGSLAVEAGCRWEMGDPSGNLQPGTLMYTLAGVDQDKYSRVTQEERTALAYRGIEEGVLNVDALRARPLPNGLLYCNMSRVIVNPLDPFAWSRAEMEGRKQVQKIHRFFSQNVPGFEQAVMVSTGQFLGLRDSRRVIGTYILKKDDIVEGTRFEDAVAASSYPIDIHDVNGYSCSFTRPKNGNFYVPYRAMVTGVRNLILAGRCISADYEAHACIRVMVTCMRIGAAAGLAAYESIARSVDANQLDGRILSGQLM